MATSAYICDGALLTAATTTYGTIVPLLTKRIIKSATLTNTTAAPVACTVFLVPSGSGSGVSNAVIWFRTVAPGETYNCPELVNQGVGPSGSVQAVGLGVTFKYTATDLT